MSKSEDATRFAAEILAVADESSMVANAAQDEITAALLSEETTSLEIIRHRWRLPL
jgi:hypothetical protein